MTIAHGWPLMKRLAICFLFVCVLGAQTATADHGLGVTQDQLIDAATADNYLSRATFDDEKPAIPDLAAFAVLNNGEFVLSAYGKPGDIHKIQIFISALTNSVNDGLSAAGNIVQLVAPDHPAPLPNIAQQMPAASATTQWISEKFLESWEFWPGRGNRREWRQDGKLIIFEGNTPDFFFMTIVTEDAAPDAGQSNDTADPEVAFADYQRDAETGDADAQHGLGEAYYYGLGVQQNYAEAVRWYRAAAEQGHGESQLFLGKPFPHGSGLNFPPKERLTWLGLAADQGNADAYHELATTQFRNPGDVEMAERSFAWCTISAELGLGEGQLCLATRYQNGWGVAQDDQQAYLWATIALKNLKPGFTAMNAAFLQADFRTKLSDEAASEADSSADAWTRKKYETLKSLCDTNDCAIWR